jgi:hypothetical protein
MVWGWLKSEQRKRRKKARLDRKYLEAKTRRFLRAYLAADEMRKPQFYRAVEAAWKDCESTIGAAVNFVSDDAQMAEDAQTTEAISNVAMKVVLARETQNVPDQDDRIFAFTTDAYATVAVAYDRAAGVYVEDSEMLQLGTAAVHLLTIATSYMMAQKG